MINKILSRLKSDDKKQANETPVNWHEDFIVELAKALKPKIYVELGLYHSELFNRLIPHAKRLIGVDIVPELEKYMKKSETTKFICKSTDEYAKDLRKKPIKIDLLFIDANHSKESVLKDFKHFFPFVSDQGMILLHDGYPKNQTQTQPGYCGDGYKAIEYLSANQKGYEMVTLPISPGLTICRKRKQHLNWTR